MLYILQYVQKMYKLARIHKKCTNKLQFQAISIRQYIPFLKKDNN